MPIKNTIFKAMGEPTHEFNIFAEPPRRGAKNAIESRVAKAVDLPKVDTFMKL